MHKMLELNEINSWEYTNDRIKYIGEDSEEHYYLLDFKVNKDSIVYYIETKGYITEKDALKWESAKNQGFKIKKWFLFKLGLRPFPMVLPWLCVIFAKGKLQP